MAKFGITLSTGQHVRIESDHEDPFTALEDCDFFTVHGQQFVVVEKINQVIHGKQRAILNAAHIVSVELVG